MTPPSHAVPPRRVGGRHVRRDVQALRAVAVALLLGWLLWPNLLPGGVVGIDVFLVVSGYLTTRSLIVGTLDRAALVTFWERRVRRLAPAALLVLAVALIATRFMAPEADWLPAARHTLAAVFQVENWLLLVEGVDPQAGVVDPAPAQQFWILSVVVQATLVWPLLLGGIASLADRRGLDRRRAWEVTITALLVCSFAYSTWARGTAEAFLATPGRLWEFALGGLVAVVAARSRGARRATPARGSSALAWTGVAGIAAAVVLGSPAGGAPFWWMATVAAAGTALVLTARAHDGRWSPERIGGLATVQWLGDTSYSASLWIWPLIVLIPHVSGGELGLLDRVGIGFAVLVLGDFTRRAVEDRWRRRRHGTPARRVFATALAAALAVTALCVAQGVEVRHRDSLSRQALTELSEGGRCFGAESFFAPLGACERRDDGPLTPSPGDAGDDLSASDTARCTAPPPYSSIRTCTFGDGDTTVALVGNLRASQWLPPLMDLAETYDLRITTFLADRCSTVDGLLDAPFAAECRDWSDAVRKRTDGDAFDLVITSQHQEYPMRGYALDESFVPWRAAFTRYLRDWTANRTRLVVIRDTPSIGRDVPACVAAHIDRQSACSGPRENWLSDDPLYSAAQTFDPNRIQTMDPNDAICTPARCFAVNGGVITYADDVRLTATYARTLAPLLDDMLGVALGR